MCALGDRGFKLPEDKEILHVDCSWCGSVIVEGNSEKVSHGMCPDCDKTERAKLGLKQKELDEQQK
jgi:hypothetical protein